MFYQIFTDIKRFLRTHTRSTLRYVFEVYVQISLDDPVQCLEHVQPSQRINMFGSSCNSVLLLNLPPHKDMKFEVLLEYAYCVFGG